MLHSKASPLRTHAVTTVDGLHVLHVAEYGSPGGSPVVYLHGGPGGGIPADAPRLFDPSVFHVIVFDQRGCGRSTCADRLRANTTDSLISDVETVRTHLGLERWGVVGSSYGALLTALYCARHASRVAWAIVHGAFLGTRAEVGWLYEDDGAARFYPQQWDALAQAAAASGVESDGGGLAPAPTTLHPPRLVLHFQRILTAKSVGRTHPPPPDSGALPAAALLAARALTAWEDEMETLAPMPASHDPAELLAGAQIAVHYFAHGCHLRGEERRGEPAAADGASSVEYVPEGILPELRASATALGSVPCAIIHGRHDVVCPPRAAYRLHAVWPHATLRIVEGGAHALFEKSMRAAAQAALAAFSAAALPAAAGKRRRAADG